MARLNALQKIFFNNLLSLSFPVTPIHRLASLDMVDTQPVRGKIIKAQWFG